MKKQKYEPPVFDWSDVKKRGLENVVDMTKAETAEWKQQAAWYRKLSYTIGPVHALVCATASVFAYGYGTSWAKGLDLGQPEAGLLTASIGAAAIATGFLWMSHLVKNAVYFFNGRHAAKEAFDGVHARLAETYKVEELEAEEITGTSVEDPADVLEKKLAVIKREWVLAEKQGREVDAAFWCNANREVSEQARIRTRERMDARRKEKLQQELLDD